MFDFWPLSYVDHKFTLKEMQQLQEERIIDVFCFREYSSIYLSLDFYMENFHLFFSPLLPEKGTFLTPKKRHMLE